LNSFIGLNKTSDIFIGKNIDLSRRSEPFPKTRVQFAFMRIAEKSDRKTKIRDFRTPKSNFSKVVTARFSYFHISPRTCPVSYSQAFREVF
jgi:hypothetical protein